jgi:hypothetical protein
VDAIDRVQPQEKELIENVFYLPIDQRNSFIDLMRITDLMKNE